MAKITNFFDWLEDDNDDSLDILDFITGFAEVLTANEPDIAEIYGLAADEEAVVPVSERELVAAGSSAAAMAAADPYTHSWDKPGELDYDEIPDPEAERRAGKFSAVAAESTRILTDWFEGDYELSDQSELSEVFDLLTE
jgi:hypothetical protein